MKLYSFEVLIVHVRDSSTLELMQQGVNHIVSFYHSGASEPKNMAYMSRLGIWGPGTPFREFSDFIQAVERR